ncbi:class I glutamine amidotransferase-like protein [Neurospora tetraspora]|uniref:Class I glutamine amidotransferase-like protein n=1 Tax=Neurospora tetraspora TaxID=94610 RepID=A0AAE0MNT4_9PEZI|nr:class I glutamine amidotransferase-like protein [Neurospora tetraspora]
MASPTATIPPPTTPLRLAILEADTPPAGAHARYSGYRGVFTHLFTRALASPEHPLSSYLTITAHDVVNNISPSDPYGDYPSLSEVDAILITGSKHSAYENDPWILTLTEFVRRAITEGDAENGGRTIKVLGVCFGHQIVGRALGQVVERNEKGWEVSVTRVGLTSVGKGLFGGREDLKIQQMHRDHVVGVPEGAQLLASTDVCENQGFIIPGKVLTVQGHPEFTTDIMEELLELRRATGLFNEELFGSGVERNKVDDGVFIAQAFYRFLLQE